MLLNSRSAKRSWLWAITPDTITSIALPPRAEIETSARKIYELLTARQPKKDIMTESQRQALIDAADAKFRTEAAAMSRMLFGDVASSCGESGKAKGWLSSRLGRWNTRRSPCCHCRRRRDGEREKMGDGATGRRGDGATGRQRNPVAPSPRRPVRPVLRADHEVVVCHQLLRSPSSAAKPPGGRRPRRCWPPWPIQSSTQMIHAWQPQEKKPLRTA